jgi:histidinol phosphatase-like enzyme
MYINDGKDRDKIIQEMRKGHKSEKSLKFQDELRNKIKTLEDAKEWIIIWANQHGQVLQTGEFKGEMFSVRAMAANLSLILDFQDGEHVGSAYESTYGRELYDCYQDSVELPK